ncbi:MAG: PhzF family isomerase [Ignavibacteria bacterium]|jgi:PhzF family phenazine biosynthesis protein
MKKKYKIYQVDAFTTVKFYGNPAGVVSNADDLADQEMQTIAREMNNSETAFILSPDADDHDVRVRFFTPIVEVPTCGHATIAAHFIRAIENNLPSCTVTHKIGIGVLPVEIQNDNGKYKIIMTQGKVTISEPFDDQLKNKVLSAMGLFTADLDERCPMQIVSTGAAKVIVGLKSKDKLNSLRPDLMELVEISKEINCNGYFTFTLESDSGEVLTNGRMFAPAIGIAEDPVTGNGNGPLGAYLVKHRLVDSTDSYFKFKTKQGEAMGRPGYVDVEVESHDGNPTKVKVGGNAVIVFKTEIEL